MQCIIYNRNGEWRVGSLDLFLFPSRVIINARNRHIDAKRITPLYRGIFVHSLDGVDFKQWESKFPRTIHVQIIIRKLHQSPTRHFHSG